MDIYQDIFLLQQSMSLKSLNDGADNNDAIINSDQLSNLLSASPPTADFQALPPGLEEKRTCASSPDQLVPSSVTKQETSESPDTSLLSSLFPESDQKENLKLQQHQPEVITMDVVSQTPTSSTSATTATTLSFWCDHCNQQFETANALRLHQQTLRQQILRPASDNRRSRNKQRKKEYKCNFCSKSFCQAGDLKRHKRIHTGEKPFKCNICNKRFTQKGNLHKHEAIHERSSDNLSAAGKATRSCTHCASKDLIISQLEQQIRNLNQENERLHGIQRMQDSQRQHRAANDAMLMMAAQQQAVEQQLQQQYQQQLQQQQHQQQLQQPQHPQQQFSLELPVTNQELSIGDNVTDDLFPPTTNPSLPLSS